MSSVNASSKLVLDELSVDRSSAVEALYELYAALFPLPDEREPIEAVYDILRLNENLAHQTTLGPWREFVTAIRFWQGGPVVGGHIFGVTTSPAHVAHGCMASVQGIYTFFAEVARHRTPMAEIKAYFQARALGVFGFESGVGKGAGAEPLIFFEVNNPLKMSAQEIADDTKSSWNPFLRYEFWRKKGFRPLDFKYVQPPLRPDAGSVTYLDLFCVTDADSVPAAVIINHLRAFISISVLKGRPADDDPDFRAMCAELGDRQIAFKSPDSTELQELRRTAAKLKGT